MRRLLAVLIAVLAPAPATALAVPSPVVGKNAELLTQLPEAAGAIAIDFSHHEPLMVVSTLKGIHTYDITDPAAPARVGYLPMVIEQNEGMDIIERQGGKQKYALIGSNGAVAGLRGTSLDTDTASKKLLVVDISDAAAPKLISSVVTPTRTHTVSCPTRSCEFAYSDGRAGSAMSIVDLRDPANPKVAGTFKSVVPAGHDQDVDESGVFWHVGAQGSVALDVSDPLAPVQLNSTNAQGLPSSDYTGKPYNNFIHHNSHRPNADAFDDGGAELDSGAPSIERGNVLLVTEEDYLNTTGAGTGRCGDYEGSFQTWYVPWLDASEYARVNPDRRTGAGTMTPLDRWNTELLDSGQPTPAGAFCSAHYFDFHHKGFVAQGWYQQGTRILDVRDPTNIKQVGYWFTGALETWASYWVPKKWSKDRAIVYTADAVRGIDVLDIALPTTSAKRTKPVRAPILETWVQRKKGLALRASADWGFLCPLTR